MSLRFHPEADDDVVDAFDWYSAQRDGLGEEFVDAVDAVAARLVEKLFHRALPRYETAGVKVAAMGRFPYRLLYIVDDDVVVFAVAHDRRHPDYWAHRLSG